MNLNELKEVARLREQSSFLGYEFLTWLFLSLTEDEKKDIDYLLNSIFRAETRLVLGGKLQLCLFNHKEQKTTVVSPLLEESHEIFASLKNGQMVEALSFSLAMDEITIGFSLHAQDFAITQVKIKNNFESDQSEQDEEDLLAEDIFLRMKALSEVEELIDGLWAQFMTIRLNTDSFTNRWRGLSKTVEERLRGQLQRASMQFLH